MSQPVRTCIGCRAREPQAELVRLVWNDVAQQVVVSRTGPGRGAWLHPGCAGVAAKRGALARALRRPGVQLPELG